MAHIRHDQASRHAADEGARYNNGQSLQLRAHVPHNMQLQPHSQPSTDVPAWAVPVTPDFLEPASPDADLSWLADLQPLPFEFSPEWSHNGPTPNTSSPADVISQQYQSPPSAVSADSFFLHDLQTDADKQRSGIESDSSSNAALAAFDALMRCAHHPNSKFLEVLWTQEALAERTEFVDLDAVPRMELFRFTDDHVILLAVPAVLRKLGVCWGRDALESFGDELEGSAAFDLSAPVALSGADHQVMQRSTERPRLHHLRSSMDDFELALQVRDRSPCVGVQHQQSHSCWEGSRRP